jgi:uncharacterized PurR-regulated membrane protein YhhQ (DUF165 family)
VSERSQATGTTRPAPAVSCVATHGQPTSADAAPGVEATSAERTAWAPPSRDELNVGSHHEVDGSVRQQARSANAAMRPLGVEPVDVRPKHAAPRGRSDRADTESHTRERPNDPRTVVWGSLALVGLVATVCAANWLVAHLGVVGVGFGLQAPAGVYAIGIAFTLRDLAQRALGARWVIAGVAVGALISVEISQSFALISGCVFLASEFADLAVYTPLARRSWLGAVVLSNTVGLAVDSVLFLGLAFGSLEYIWGQIVGKAWMTAAAVVGVTAVRAVLAASAVARR